MLYFESKKGLCAHICFVILFADLHRWHPMDQLAFLKLKHSENNKVMNVYQKPQALLDWIVARFSLPGDWILDLCFGLGTGLASALSLGRHCVAVEKDFRQAMVLRGRVLNLGE